MGFAFIREGDRTTHGGIVQKGSPTDMMDGKAMAMLGDMVSCPRCGGVFPIVTTKPLGMTFDGRPPATEGDKTACGAELIASQHNSTADMTGGAGNPMGGTTAVYEKDSSSRAFRGRFQVLDPVTGAPAKGHAYSLRTSRGEVMSGVTGSQGYMQWHEADEPASLLFGHGPSAS
ncbi:PAAR motif family protein [Burkholderia pseudomallei]|nr:PAAR motif family protein [Burkholderia pseudomallei]CAJ6628144.1 PAAR motif family protein [Burkholderia pseudomallei]